MEQLLIVEDDRELNQGLCKALAAENRKLISCQTIKAAREQLMCGSVSLVLLDINLPDGSGFELLREVKEQNPNIPIILLTANDTDMDIVEGLEKGADDYITKPFGAAELLARIRVAIRHSRNGIGSGSIAKSGKFVSGDLTIDYDKHQVLISGKNAHLTQNEFRIVALLGKCAGKVLTYDFIMKELWGPQSKGNNQILRVNMANIRRKIEVNPAEPQYIFTEVGVGYRMIEGD